MDLVDDDRVHGPEDASRLGGEQQVERFGGGDEDVRRVRGDGVAIFGRRIAAARGDADVRCGPPELFACAGDAVQWRFEVPGHVHGEGLQWGDVEDAHAAGVAGFGASRLTIPSRRSRQPPPAGAGIGTVVRMRRVGAGVGIGTGGHEPVDGEEEGGECLAGAGGRYDQHVAAGSDGRPRLALCLGRLIEGALEPDPCGFGERRQSFAHMFNYRRCVRQVLHERRVARNDDLRITAPAPTPEESIRVPGYVMRAYGAASRA